MNGDRSKERHGDYFSIVQFYFDLDIVQILRNNEVQRANKAHAEFLFNVCRKVNTKPAFPLSHAVCPLRFVRYRTMGRVGRFRIRTLLHPC